MRLELRLSEELELLSTVTMSVVVVGVVVGVDDVSYVRTVLSNLMNE